MITLPIPRRLHLQWLLLAILVGVVSAIASGQPPQTASAHALLVRADPPVNATLREPPTAMTLYFSEALEHKFSNVEVKDQSGARVDDSFDFDASDNAVMHVALKTVGPGFLTVYWATVSAVDGHRISGSYPLTILNPDGSVPAGKPATTTASTSGTSANPARVAVKLLLLLGGAALTGAFVFMTFVSPGLPGAEGERAREAIDGRAMVLVGVALLLLILGGLGELLVQASYVGTGAGNLLHTHWGDRWLLRNLTLIAPLVALLLCNFGSEQRRGAAAIGALGAVAYLGVVSSVSHGAAGGGAFWAVASDFVHLIAASVWIGLLAMLVLLFRWARDGLVRGEKYPVLAAAVQRFSSIAVVSVALLLFTGSVNSVIEVGSIDDLTATGYGEALLIKLALIVPLLAMGSMNAYTLRPRFVEAAVEGQRSQRNRTAELETRLARTIRYELFFAVAVLAAVAVLVQLVPSRGKVAAPEQTGKFTASKDAVNGIAVTIVVDPNQPGNNTFEVYLTGLTNTVESVRLDFSRPGKSGSESRLDMTATNPPTFYVAQGPFLTEPGRWNVGVDVRRTTGSDLLFPFSVPVGGVGDATSKARQGGSFSVPVSVGWETWALVAVSGVLAGGLVLGSRTRPGLPTGYFGRVADAVNERVSLTRPVWSLTLLIAVGIGFGLLLGSHYHPRLSPQQATKGNPVATSPASIQRGAMLFQANCTQCHGESGRGDGPLAKSLPIPPANLYDHIPYHPDDFFFSVITNGLAGVMPGFSNQLSPDDRWNILNYLRDRFGSGPPTSEAPPPR